MLGAGGEHSTRRRCDDQLSGLEKLSRRTAMNAVHVVRRGTNRGIRGRIASIHEGRFRRGEPMGFAAGDENLYRYVDNDPTGSTDPTGTDRRIGTWIGHGYIEIRLPDGSTITLNFGPKWSENSSDGGFYEGGVPTGCVPITPWIPSTPKEDEELRQLWRDLEAARKRGEVNGWMGPFFNLGWNCWGPVFIFWSHGMAPRKQPPYVPGPRDIFGKDMTRDRSK